MTILVIEEEEEVAVEGCEQIGAAKALEKQEEEAEVAEGITRIRPNTAITKKIWEHHIGETKPQPAILRTVVLTTKQWNRKVKVSESKYNVQFFFWKILILFGHEIMLKDSVQMRYCMIQCLGPCWP
mmetsp:Transcript_24350/g.37560  ORF Transcript_24350/g.37560 Transcript_24350/m.37560 type:complete len:127 (+) Transcript_24350:748-1128(+)